MRIGMRKLETRVRAQAREARNRSLDFFDRDIQRLRYFRIAELQEVVVLLFENLDGETREVRDGVSLDQEAFALVAGADARRLEGLQDVNRLAHRKARVFEGKFPAEDTFNFVDVLVVRLDHHDFGIAVAIGIAEKPVIVDGIDEITDKLAEMFVGDAAFLELFLQLARTVPEAELVFELFLKALAHILDGAVPIFVRVLGACIQVLEGRVVVRGPITEITVPVHVRRGIAIEVASIDFGRIVQRTPRHVFDIFGKFLGFVRARVHFFGILVNRRQVVKVAIIDFQKRVDLGFFLDGGFQFLRSFLKHLHRLEKRRR